MLLIGAYALDRGLCRKPRVAPAPPPAETEASGHASASVEEEESAPSRHSSPSFARRSKAHDETESSFSGHAMGLLQGKILGVMSALSGSFRASAGEGGERAVGGGGGTKPSVTRLVGRWGHDAGVISDDQLREMQMQHLSKYYVGRRVQHKRDMLRRLTGAAAAPKAPAPKAPTPTAEANGVAGGRRSVLAHARSTAAGLDADARTEAIRMHASEEGGAPDMDDELTWLQNLKAAFLVHGGDESAPRTCSASVSHVVALPWKVIVALLPPAHLGASYPLFASSIGLIGAITFLIDDVASQFGCCCGIPNSITAISFVALGTSMPDTLASRSAAIHDDYADDSVGNITGSNSVNVFLGIGLPWLIGAIYWSSQGLEGMPVPVCSLGFSVIVFLITALLCLALLIGRRHLYGYELGGERKWTCGIALTSLWFLYLALASLQAVDVVRVAITSDASLCV